MTDFNRHSPHYLIAKYMQGDLCQEESLELLHLLQRNSTVFAVLKANLLSDAWLDELKQKKSLANDQMNSNEMAELFHKAAMDIEYEQEKRNDLSPFSEAETVSIGADWDDLVRLQNEEKPIAQMTPDEFEAYRASLAAKSQESLSSSGAELQEEEEDQEEFDPFAILRELEEKEKRIHQPVQRKRYQWTMNDFVFIACILLAVTLGIGVYLEGNRNEDESPLPSSVAMTEDDFNPVARVTELIDPVWSHNAIQYQRGQAIDTGKLALLKGMAKVEFQNGAVVTLEAPIDLNINGAREMFCSLGQLSATIPPSAIGFRVSTPFGVVEDLGTEFFVNVAQDIFEVETNKGLVEITAANRSVISLKQKEAIFVKPNGTNKKYSPNVSRFTTWESFEARLSSYIAELRKEKEKLDIKLDADPNLLVRFDASHRKDNVIPNTSLTGKNRCSELNVQGAPIAKGRWHGSPAIGFTSKTENCTFTLQGSYRRLVLTANIRFDHLGTQENTLCASQDFMKVPGTILWQICRTGELILFVTTSEDHVKMYASSSVMNVRDCGIWYNLSVVIDADHGTISHYVNSKLISTVPWQEPQNINPGKCMLGHAPRNVQKRSGKHFDGAIDEFRISTE